MIIIIWSVVKNKNLRTKNVEIFFSDTFLIFYRRLYKTRVCKTTYTHQYVRQWRRHLCCDFCVSTLNFYLHDWPIWLDYHYQLSTPKNRKCYHFNPTSFNLCLLFLETLTLWISLKIETIFFKYCKPTISTS